MRLSLLLSSLPSPHSSAFLSLTDRCGKIAEHPAVPAREAIGFLLEVAILILHSLNLGPDEDEFTDNIWGKENQREYRHRE